MDDKTEEEQLHVAVADDMLATQGEVRALRRFFARRLKGMENPQRLYITASMLFCAEEMFKEFGDVFKLKMLILATASAEVANHDPKTCESCLNQKSHTN